MKYGLATSKNECFDCRQLGLFSTIPVHFHCRWNRPTYELGDILSVKNSLVYITQMNNESSCVECSSMITSSIVRSYIPYHWIEFIIAKYQSPSYYKIKGAFI